MTTPGPGNTSQTARLMVNPPGFAVGWQEPVYLPNPPAGQNWSYTVDGRYYERVVAVQYVFTASAAAGNRFPSVALADANGTQVTIVPGGQNVAPSTAVDANLTVGAPGFAQGTVGNTVGYIPDLLIPPGWRWRSVTGGIDVADQFSGIVLLVQRFPNDAAAITAG